MSNQHSFYYALNAYPCWTSSFVPMSQFYTPLPSAFLPGLSPKKAQASPVIDVKEEHKPQDLYHDQCQIINPTVQNQAQQASTKSTSKSNAVKQDSKHIAPECTNATKPGRWSREEHERFMEGI